jgi:hypothetical protein
MQILRVEFHSQLAGERRNCSGMIVMQTAPEADLADILLSNPAKAVGLAIGPNTINLAAALLAVGVNKRAFHGRAILPTNPDPRPECRSTRRKYKRRPGGITGATFATTGAARAAWLSRSAPTSAPRPMPDLASAICSLLDSSWLRAVVLLHYQHRYKRLVEFHPFLYSKF